MALLTIKRESMNNKNVLVFVTKQDTGLHTAIMSELLQLRCESSGALAAAGSVWLSGSGLGPDLCFSKNFPEDAYAAGPQTTPWVASAYISFI